MVLVFALVLLGFLLGVVAILVAEALGLLWILKRLREKITSDQSKISSITQLGSAQFDPHLSFKKEGVVWVLDPDKVSKYWLDRSSREQKRKKEFLEVSPVRKYAKINGQSLVLTETDGLHTTIELKGCLVEAVSATNIPAKKWAKKFPIKVESKTSMIYYGSKTLYVYLETSSEKEAWCKALRLAACDKKEQLEWFTQLQEEFHSYLTSLNTEYHSIMKPSLGSSIEAIERASKSEGGSSKVRHFLKKLSKKTSISSREERKKTEKLRASQDAVLTTAFMKSASTANHMKNSMLDDATPSSSTLSHSDSQSHISVCSDTDDKFGIDDGTLCWNLLISRLFFDVKGNVHMKRSVQERIQRTLSNVRTPTYLGEVICTDINLGNVPPCILGMRVLPMEMNEVCALEVDIEYSGSAVLEIETRLEVREQREKEDSNPETYNVGSVRSDLLKDFEYLDKQLNIAEGVNNLQEPKGDGHWNVDVSKSFKNNTPSATPGSRWRSMLHSVAKQVSQVPISLAIRVDSLRGTLRLLIKPPPSDQLWYGFTFMPDIDFNLASSVGEHKITNARVALFLINRIKAAIRETLVLPNSESVSISWMLAEKDDWVPRNVAPFIWVNQDSGNETSTSIDINNQPSSGLKASSMNTESSQQPARKSDSVAVPSSSYSSTILRNSKSLQELTKPLLENDQPQEASDLKELSTPLLSGNIIHEAREEKMEDVSVSESPLTGEVTDTPSCSTEQPKKVGKREMILDFRKRMSGKFEEKKRHIVEKMRGP